MARTKKISTQDTINIKSLPVQAHIGASKYVNNDWGTIAFIIPRKQLQLKFADKELRYNCIYFLFGFDQTTEKVYVGQAKKRNNGESVLARLREHDTSKTESYRDIWEWAVVCTGKEDTWSLDDLNALEHAFYNEIPTTQNLNGNNPNSGGANYDAYTDKIRQIKNYITSIGFNLFADNEDTEKIQVTSEVNENTIVEDLQNGLARIPEIVTPHKVVKAMCDILPPEVWNDQTVFLDPACKGGEYLREIYDRLMDCEILQSKYPDEFERSNHILGKQLYGIALSQVSLERTTKKLRGYDHNLRVIPNYIRKLKGIGLGSRPDGTSKTMQDILNEEFNRDMKIDVVIGNPPYSEESGGGGRTNRQGKTIYNLFIELGINIANNICMITKNNWLSSDTLSTLRKQMILNGLFSIYNYPEYGEIFKGVSVSVASFIIKKGYQGEISYTEIRNNKCCSNYYANLNDIECVPECIELYNIIKKSKNNKSFEKFVYSKMPFGIASNGRIGATGTGDFIDESPIRTEYYDTPILYNDGYSFIHSKDIPKNSNIKDNYKVACGQQLRHDDKVIYNLQGINAGSITSQSFAILFDNKDKKLTYNALLYLKTKFARVLIRCITDEICTTTPIRFKLLPTQDFTPNSDIDWSESISDIDQQLYKKYGLTQEEIDYIEKTIKPME